MARINLIETKNQAPPDAQPVYDEIAASRGRVVGPFAVLLHSPELAQKVSQLGAFIRYGSDVPDSVRELATCTVGREMDALYVWSSHVELARKAGVPETTLGAVKEGRPVEDEHQDLIAYVRALVRKHRAPEELFQRLQARFGPKGMLELTATVGYYSMMAAVLNGFEVEPEAGAEILPWLNR
jgi:4-carboxymuconolactone decarboxylase